MGMSPTDRNIKKEIRFLRAFSLRLVTDPLIKRQTFMGGKKSTTKADSLSISPSDFLF